MSEVHAETVPFVRGTMLPEAPPPAGERGAIHWLRANLFSGWVNTILTFVGLFVLWWLFQHFYPWFRHSVWNASSMAECRTLITERWGEGAGGGCFGLVRERWNQFLFGFYPPAEYWRPISAFWLLFLALAPVLFTESRKLRWIVVGVASVMAFALSMLMGAPDPVLICLAVGIVLWVVLIEYIPRAALIVSVIFPFLAVWLLWGGSIWGPATILAGAVLGLAVWGALSRFGALAVLAGLAVAVLWWWFLSSQAAIDLQRLLPLELPKMESRGFGGFLLAITIGVSAIVMSLPLGIILALARQSDLPIVKGFAVIFIEFIRGVPLITLLFVASLLLNYFLPPGTNFDIILRVIIMVTLFASAYMAEVIRGGLASLPRGQYEAAGALGLNYWKMQRLIILPQALKVSIPGIVGTFIGVFKDTTLVTFVGLFDPLKQLADTIRATFEWKGAYWEPYIFSGLIFFILCFSMSRYSMYLEQRLKRDHR